MKYKTIMGIIPVLVMFFLSQATSGKTIPFPNLETSEYKFSSSNDDGFYGQPKELPLDSDLLDIIDSDQSELKHPDSWPFNYVNILIFRFQFRDKKLNWSEDQINKIMEEVNQYYKDDSYGNFKVTWDLSESMININDNISKFKNQTVWRNKRISKIKERGIDIYNPGKDNIVMMVAPEGMEAEGFKYNSTAAPPVMNIYHHKSGTIAHEIGHAIGLKHSMAIEAGHGRVIGTGNQKKEALNYGNVYAMMGMGAHTLEEYNLLYKSFFTGWITDSDVPLVSSSGTYKIYAFDQGSKTAGPIGIRLKSGDGKYTYWVEYRTSNKRYPETKNGVLLNLEGYWMKEQTDKRFSQTVSYLLDMTPGSKTPKAGDWWAKDQTDSELVIGKSYTDHWRGFTIKPIEKGGTEDTADAWIEVEVTML